METLVSKLADMDMKTTILIPGIPDELAMECLVRVPLDYQTLCSMRKVSRKWRALLSGYDSGILKERRIRQLQLPSLFLFPCTDKKIVRVKNSATCSYKIDILMLGGCRDGRSLKEFWIIDTLKRTVKRGPDMLQRRECFSGAVVGDSLYAVAGECDGHGQFIDNVERYDFATQVWIPVSPLPFQMVPCRCYVDSFSSSTPKLLVGADYGRDKISQAAIYGSVTFSYCPATDTWKLFHSYEDVPAPPKPFMRSSRWLLCGGGLIFQKDSINCKEGDNMKDKKTWKLFPSNMGVRVPAVFFWVSLMQRTNPADDGFYQDPMITMDLTPRHMVFSEGDIKDMNSFVVPALCADCAVFYPLSTLTKIHQSSFVCDFVATDAMRDRMQISDRKKEYRCPFQVLFY